MPAKLTIPAVKVDTQFWRDDVTFLRSYLVDKNRTFTDVARDLVHRYANEKRKQLGQAPTAPHPPGTLP